MNPLKIVRQVAVLGVGLALPSLVYAETCPSSNKPVAGTLAAASNPCTPAPTPQAKKLSVVRGAPKQPDTKAPGTYRYGNTTIHIGGSVSTDVNARGR